jgi:serine/threonine protein kinase
MPDNTWFTPYKFPASACLSLGPSQGIVYRVSKRIVIKMPFQYPVQKLSKELKEEGEEKMYMSLRSFAVFRRECLFYNIAAKTPHRNVAQRLQCKNNSCILLEYFQPIRQAWSQQTRGTRLTWILQLLDVLEWLEGLGYTHGDLKLSNMGIDDCHQLRVFDFGSIRHQEEVGFDDQVLEDHFSLATCIHALASGVDPIADARSRIEVRRIFKELQEGRGVISKEAIDFKDVIQAGWTRVPRPTHSFSKEREAVTRIIEQITKNGSYQSQDSSTSYELVKTPVVVMDEDARWMDEDNYRVAWEAAGFKPPDNIWD